MIDDEIEFVEELPGETRGGGRPSKIKPILEQLKAKPGVWARVETITKKAPGNTCFRQHLAREQLQDLYETTQRRDSVKGVILVYARYVGPVEAT